MSTKNMHRVTIDIDVKFSNEETDNNIYKSDIIVLNRDIPNIFVAYENDNTTVPFKRYKNVLLGILPSIVMSNIIQDLISIESKQYGDGLMVINLTCDNPTIDNMASLKILLSKEIGPKTHVNITNESRYIDII